MESTSCHWCGTQLNDGAVACHACTRLRLDIYTDRLKSYVGLLIAVVIIVVGSSAQGGMANAVFSLCGLFALLPAIFGLIYVVVVSLKLKTWCWA